MQFKKIILTLFLGIGAWSISLAQPAASTDKSFGSLVSVLELEENLSFVRTINGILASLKDIHEVAKAEQSKSLEIMLKKSNIRKLMTQDVGCTIPFDVAGTDIGDKEKAFLGSFMNTLDSIQQAYKSQFSKDLTFKIAVLGYTDKSGTEQQNKALSEARAKISAEYLLRLAEKRNLRLQVPTVEGRASESPDGLLNCEAKDARCRVCKIVLLDIIP